MFAKMGVFIHEFLEFKNYVATLHPWHQKRILQLPWNEKLALRLDYAAACADFVK